MNEYQKRFIALLKTIFELDKSDLDFGIYRIINIRQREITDYFENRLPKKITEILTPFASAGKESIRQRIAAIENEIAQLGMTIDALPDNAPKKLEYISLNKQLAQGTDISALESDVYSALFSFFNRYYDEGDFISKRRYKEGVYAIPYEGEEVKLYWANQDQYYIKTSENFKDYTFVTEEGINVHFRLVDATTEQNNNKEAENAKRAFMLYTESDERPELKTFEWNEDDRELIIRFIYDVPADKKKKWDEANFKAIKEWLSDHTSLMMALLRNSVAGDPKSPSVIEKHLKAYVAKNTFDYFIHKDLGGFLNRELDFFIKNEIMHLDDLDTDDERRAESYLAKVRAVKRIGKEIIAFLAQIENFQRKLWLKKKFVVETNWCITLDRIDEQFYPEIIACEAQVQEWIDMYRIDEIKGDLTTTAFTNPPTIEFLRENQNLIVDTANFPTTFRDRLIASIDNLDENTGGLMINGDNFHALNLLTGKYANNIQSIYIDPPYNTNASEILYKNGYKEASWCSLMNDRISLGNYLLSNSGILNLTIDYKELFNVGKLSDQIFNELNRIGIVTIFINPKGRQHERFYSSSTEYMLVYARNVGDASFNKTTISTEKSKEFIYTDENGKYRLDDFRRMRTNTSRINKPQGYYPLYISKDLKIVSKEEFSNSIQIFPIKNGIEYTWKIIESECNEDIIKKLVAVYENGEYFIKNKYYEQQVFHNIWTDKKYFSEFNGTNLLKDMMGYTPFQYPKSLYAVMDTLKICHKNNSFVLDYFAGSGTTGHATIELNRQDNGNRKYILVEMGEYFSTATHPRVKKAVYSPEWKNGVPQRRDAGVSHIMKYMRLESYEDALSNISLDKKDGFSKMFGDQYLINYMLNIEAKGSLLNLEAFNSPFDYKMKITEKNECRPRKVDVVETFNYLIGLTVSSQSAIAYFKTCAAASPANEGAVDLVKDNNGDYAFRQIEGTLPDGRRALVIWRNIKADNIAASNAALDAYFSRYRINPQDREFDVIFVNGDSNVENLRLDSENWKVVRTEAEFNRLMWTE